METPFSEFERVVVEDKRRVNIDKGNMQMAFDSVSVWEEGVTV